MYIYTICEIQISNNMTLKIQLCIKTLLNVYIHCSVSNSKKYNFVWKTRGNPDDDLIIKKKLKKN